MINWTPTFVVPTNTAWRLDPAARVLTDDAIEANRRNLAELERINGRERVEKGYSMELIESLVG